ncbi:hypothetical protein AB0B03_10280 [Micromonospora chalcea]
MVTTGNADADRVLLALLTMQRESWEQGILGQALLDLGLDETAGRPGPPTARCSTCSTAARSGRTRSTWWCRCWR